MENQLSTYMLVGLVAAWFLYTTVKKSRTRQVVARKLQEDPLIVDVRTPGEYQAGHYPNAVNIPLQKIEQSLKRFGAKEGPIIVYCASGSRSRAAAGILRAQGFTDVTNGGGLNSLPR